MSEWKATTLGDCCTSITDGDHQSLPVSEKGTPFIIISNIRNNRIDFTNTRFVPNDYYDSLDSTRKPSKGDLLYTVKGSFGIPVYVDTDNAFVFQRDIAILKCNNTIDSKFLYYVLKSHMFAQKADSLAIGSAQRALTLKTLRNMDFSCPSLDIQTRIVKMLEVYDHLIENNQRQIKLLEEVAQRLYKEWFIDLHFPGYEDTPIVDGVPEGWKKGMLGDISPFRRGKSITKAQVLGGDVPVVAGGLEPAYYHNKANTIAPVITVSGSGVNAGFTRLYNVDVFASDCSYIDSNSTPFLLFVYCFLKTNKMNLDSLQKGSAQPHVYAKDLNALALSVPLKI